ncbi:hypothetical protein PIB30_048392, partial [Stylosanthes scabra]|nr:hypothetical protein [Stylosanthes scabra]
TMDQIAHGYVASRPTDDAVYRPSPPLQPYPNHSQPCQEFQYYQPSQQSFLHRNSNISCPHRIARRTTSHHCSRCILRLHGLSHITNPPSAITHRLRSPSRTIRHIRLSAHGHSGYRGIAIRPLAAHHHISTIVRRTRATGTR